MHQTIKAPVAAHTVFDPARHETLQPFAWDTGAVRAAIQATVADTEQHFDASHFWPAHPRDRATRQAHSCGLTPLYHGACGVVWALHYLQDKGAATLQRNYVSVLDATRSCNQAWLGEVYPAAAASYLMGDTPFLLMQWAHAQDRCATADKLAQLIADIIDDPNRELMWGSPGTLLAAFFLHDQSGDARWSDLFVHTAAKLWSQLRWSDEFGCRYWTQDIYGRECTYLDGVRGFVATAFVLIKGRNLLAPQDWQAWERCIEQTMARPASEVGGLGFAVYLWDCLTGEPRFPTLDVFFAPSAKA